MSKKQKPSIIFRASQFTPTQWDTAEVKAKFANHFVRFVESDFERRLFTKAFYERLSNTFGHIAHYNLDGFWNEFFTSLRGKCDFLEQTCKWPCWGSPEFTYSDVEQVIRSWVKGQHLHETYVQRHNEFVEQAERRLYEQLKEKFG